MATLLAARRGDAARVEERRATRPTPTRRVFASGALLPGPGATLAGPTFEAWLDEAA